MKITIEAEPKELVDLIQTILDEMPRKPFIAVGKPGKAPQINQID